MRFLCHLLRDGGDLGLHLGDLLLFLLLGGLYHRDDGGLLLAQGALLDLLHILVVLALGPGGPDLVEVGLGLSPHVEAHGADLDALGLELLLEHVDGTPRGGGAAEADRHPHLVGVEVLDILHHRGVELELVDGAPDEEDVDGL